jgi:diguanylate cyclase (GGDEF)-like protein
VDRTDGSAGSSSSGPLRAAGANPPTVREAALARLSADLDELEFLPGRDIDAEFAAAVEAERRADELGSPAHRMRARLVRADMVKRRGDLASGIRLAWDVNRWASQQGNAPILARSHWLLSPIYYMLSDRPAALEHAIRAMELLDADTPPRTRAHYLVTLAGALAWTRAFDAARERYRLAEQILISLSDVGLRLILLNNLAYTEYRAGEPARALAAAEQLQAIAAEHGSLVHVAFSDTIARALMGVGRYAEAEQIIGKGLERRRTRGQEDLDDLAELLLTLTEAQRCQHHTEAAQATLDRCREFCEEHDLAEVLVRISQEQAELHAAQGRFELAYEVHKGFHAETLELLSLQREAQARTRQALFETTEAREEARRFREQAYRDPLTGLYNRRYIDVRLPVLIDRAARADLPLTVAVIDLDHFKRINDTLSHDVGDQVLTAVAGLLLAGMPAPAEQSGGEAGFVARMGGEEFLMVLPELAGPAALDRLESVRLAVRSHPWRPLIGDRPVTISIGAVSTDPPRDGAVAGDTLHLAQASLLADADRNLYIAKRAGRDQVVTDQRNAGERRRYRA